MTTATLPTPEAQGNQMMTVNEAAALLRLRRSTLYDLMDRGALAYCRFGRARRLRREDVDRLIESSLIGGENADA